MRASQQFFRLRKKVRSQLYYKVIPYVVDRITELGTYSARQKLRKAKISKILFDNSVLGYGVTHETAWVNTGKVMWGGAIEVETGHAARIPVYKEEDEGDIARSVRYLPGIASLARRGHLQLYVSDELRDERWTQPSGRFSGYGYYDYSLFHGVPFDTIRDPDYRIVIAPKGMNVPTIREQRETRLSLKTDPLYMALIKVLGPKNSQDAWHITTAEREGCYCFLTMDLKLVRNVAAQQQNKAIAGLGTRVMTPEEFGKQFDLKPIPTRFFSYHDASYPVIHEESWPESRRAKRSRSKPK